MECGDAWVFEDVWNTTIEESATTDPHRLFEAVNRLLQPRRLWRFVHEHGIVLPAPGKWGVRRLVAFLRRDHADQWCGRYAACLGDMAVLDPFMLQRFVNGFLDKRRMRAFLGDDACTAGAGRAELWGRIRAADGLRGYWAFVFAPSPPGSPPT